MSSIHLEIFDHKRLELFKILKVFGDNGYLAGGTGLALQINHRKSYDFDVFLPNEITNSLRREVERLFGDVSYLVDSGDQLSFQTKDMVNVTFLWYYFKPLKPFISTRSLPLASVEDIAADKAHTMGRRAAWRDYVDIYWMLHKGLQTLESISKYASHKFGGAFNETQFLEQLTYYEDVAFTPIQFIEESPSNQEIQSYLQQVVEEYAKKRLAEK